MESEYVPKVLIDFSYRTYLFNHDFEVLKDEVLGVGLNGEVTKCKCRKSGIMYAVKTLKDSDKARRELSVHSRVSFEIPDCVVKLKSIYRNKIRRTPAHNFYVVMELMEGGDLYKKLDASDNFSEEEAALTTLAMCRIVKQLHQLRILHRDIKLENFMYCDTSRTPESIRLGDFGGAIDVLKVEHRATSAHITLQYSAPEAILVAGFGSSKSDIWSIGVSLYLLLSGAMPFFAETRDATKRLIIEGDLHFNFKIWDRISEEAKHLLLAILRVNMKVRPTLDQIMESEWIQRFAKAEHTSPEKARLDSVDG